MITQKQLRTLHRTLDEIRELKQRLKAAQDDAEQQAEPVRVGLLAHPRLKIEPGAYTVALKEHSRRNPKWKDVVLERLGEPVVKEVLDATEPKTSYEVCVTRKGEGRAERDVERRIVLDGNGDDES